MKKNEKHWQILVLILKKIAENKGISHYKIAEITGMQQSNVNRIFSLKYSPTLRNFVDIAQAIQVNFFFEDKEEIMEFNEIFEAAMTELGRRENSKEDLN